MLRRKENKKGGKCSIIKSHCTSLSGRGIQSAKALGNPKKIFIISVINSMRRFKNWTGWPKRRLRRGRGITPRSSSIYSARKLRNRSQKRKARKGQEWYLDVGTDFC